MHSSLLQGDNPLSCFFNNKYNTFSIFQRALVHETSSQIFSAITSNKHRFLLTLLPNVHYTLWKTPFSILLRMENKTWSPAMNLFIELEAWCKRLRNFGFIWIGRWALEFKDILTMSLVDLWVLQMIIVKSSKVVLQIFKRVFIEKFK